jgi:hypothetical protein
MQQRRIMAAARLARCTAFVQSTWERVHYTCDMPLDASAGCWLKCHDPAIMHGCVSSRLLAVESCTGPLCLWGPLLR